MSDLLEKVRASVRERRHADQRYRAALQEARDGGVPMGRLADAAGVSRQMVLRLTVTPDGKRRKRRGVVQPVSVMQDRLAELDARWETFLDSWAPRFTHPDPRGEQARRNIENSRAKRQQAGVTRNGKRSGASGRKSVLRPTVAVETRRLAEAAALKFLEQNRGVSIVEKVVGEIAEAESLRASLDASAESSVPFLAEVV